MSPMLPTRFIAILRAEWNGRDLRVSWHILKEAWTNWKFNLKYFMPANSKVQQNPCGRMKMSDANRLQLTEILGEIFNHILDQTATSRDQDSAVLRRCVDEQLIQTAADALQYKLVDGLKYNDQVLEDIAGKVKAASITRINFVPLGKYYEAVKSKFNG